MLASVDGNNSMEDLHEFSKSNGEATQQPMFEPSDCVDRHMQHTK